MSNALLALLNNASSQPEPLTNFSNGNDRAQGPRIPTAMAANPLLGLLSVPTRHSAVQKTKDELYLGQPSHAVQRQKSPSGSTQSTPLFPSSSEAIDSASSPPVPVSSSYAHVAAMPSKFSFQNTFDPLPSAGPRLEQTIPTAMAAESNGQNESSGEAATLVAEGSSAPNVAGSTESLSKMRKKGSKLSTAAYASELVPATNLLASSHLAALHSAQAFGDASTSGLSVLNVSPNTALVSFDLTAPQPAGLGSLHAAKLEVSPIALFATPLVHYIANVSDSASLIDGVDGYSAVLSSQLHASKITNLGPDVVAYVMTKGRVRLLNLISGERTLVQTPHKRPVLSIRAFAVADETDWRLLATYEEGNDVHPEGLYMWNVTLFDDSISTEASPLPAVRVLACQEGSDYSYKAHLCAIVKGHHHRGTGTELGSHLIPNFQALVDEALDSPYAVVNVSHDSEVVASALASQGAIYVAIEAGSNYCVVIKVGEDTPRRIGLPALPEQASTCDRGHPLISFLSPVCDYSGTELRGVLIGFARNTVIGLLDPKKGEWNRLWKFDRMPSGHFNLAILDEEHSILFLANSARSSIFTLPLATRSTSDGEWSLRESNGLTEFALPEPCTSFSFAKNPDQDPSDVIRVFALHPGGVHIFDVPIVASGDQDDVDTRAQKDVSVPVAAAQQSGIAEMQEADFGAVGWLSDAASQDVASSALAPVPLQSPSRQNSPLSLATAATALPSSISLAEQGRTHSNRRGTRGGSKNKKATTTTEDGCHSRTGSAANAKLAQNGVVGLGKENVDTEKIAIEGGAADKSSELRDISMQHSLDDLESRLTKSMQQILSVNSSIAPLSIEPSALRLSPIDLSKLASEVVLGISKQLSDSLAPQVLSAVHTVLSAEMRSGFTQALLQHLPTELSRLMERPDVLVNITRAVSSGVVPVAQKTAVEVVTQVLAPHFEQTMGAVAQRVEAMIEAGMTEVRKSVVAEQSTALRATEQQIVEMAKMMSLMNQQLSELSVQNQKLTTAIDELKCTGISVANDFTPLPPAHSAPSLSRQFTAGQTQSPWVPLEPFQSAHHAHLGSISAAIAMHQHQTPPQTLLADGHYSNAHPSSSYTQVSAPPTPLPHQQSSRVPTSMSITASEEVVEDALLAALSSSEPEAAILPTLRRLKVRFSRPEFALLQRDPITGGEEFTVSQPVLLALLNTIARVASIPINVHTGAGIGAQGPDVWVPWAEASAMRINTRTESIQAAYAHVGDRIRRGFEKGWDLHHVQGGTWWWTRERLDAYLLAYLPSPSLVK